MNPQDILDAVVNQRNTALNECAELYAQIKALQREIEELKKANASP